MQRRRNEMNTEQVWQSLPIDLANAALRIARAYEHGWARSSVVPQGDAFWTPEDPRPTLEEIEEATPEGAMGKGITGPTILCLHGRYHVSHRTLTGRTTINVSRSPDDDFTRYSVTISRPNGAESYSVIEGGQVLEFGAIQTAWGNRHIEAWNRAWEALGVARPPFPGLVREWFLDLHRGDTVDVNGDLRYATVTIWPDAELTGDMLYDLVRIADSVTVRCCSGSSIRIVEQN
jgi:hypothetical protein